MTVRIVVPAYNEEARFLSDEFRVFLRHWEGIDFVLVNDGSTDGTLGVLERLAGEFPARVDVLDQQPNAGKAEAVRKGMLRALEREDTEFVGYFDADLATPLRALPAMLELFEEHPELDIVMASRVRLLGRAIERRQARHYAGRVFATFASMLLAMPVYDTQCGAKLFRRRESLRDALADAFVSHWVFDVELLRRLQIARARSGEVPVEHATFEFPLDRWRDVQGSKVKPSDFPKAIVELARIYRTYGAG